MWTVRTIYSWMKPRRFEWQVFHEDSVFEAVIVEHPIAGVVLRFQYRGQLYDEQVYPSRADAKRESAKMHRKLMMIGWSEHPGSSTPAAAHPRMGS